MNMFKRLVPSILTAAMLVTAMPQTSSAKSLSWVGREMEIRRKMQMENEFKQYVNGSPDN